MLFKVIKKIRIQNIISVKSLTFRPKRTEKPKVFPVFLGFFYNLLLIFLQFNLSGLFKLGTLSLLFLKRFESTKGGLSRYWLTYFNV